MVRRKSRGGNPADDDTSKRGIPGSIKRWVFVPIICFTGAGMGLLTYILFLLATDAVQSELAWPALVIAFAGIPSAFVANIKKLMDAAEAATS